MSQENVEVVRATFEAWNAGDMDGVREDADSDVVMRTPEDWPEQGPFVGREAVMREWEQLRQTFPSDDALDPITDLRRRRRPSRAREVPLARRRLRPRNERGAAARCAGGLRLDQAVP